MRLGGGAVAKRIVPFVGPTQHEAAFVSVRPVHAMLGVRSLLFGLPRDASLPTVLSSTIEIDPIPFASTPKPNAPTTVWSTTADGYVKAPFPTSLGFAEEGSAKAIVVASVPTNLTLGTLFAVGDAHSSSYPPRGLLCSDEEGNGLLASCQWTPLPSTLQADVFATSLWGIVAPYENERRPHIIDAIGKHQGDFLCLGDLNRSEERVQVAAAAKARYPYSYWVETDYDTAITDPTDANGVTPVLPNTPMCAAVDTAAVRQAYKCMADNCSTKPGDMSGMLQGGTDCLASRCPADIVPVYVDRRCYACLVTQVLSAATPFQTMLDRCTTDPRPQWVYDGQTNVVMLSRFPLSDQAAFILPATNYRRAVLGARAEVEPGKFVDFYCAQFDPPVESEHPYTGPYAAGDDTEGWNREQTLQAQKLVKWVQTRSATRPAIVAGNFYSTEPGTGTAPLNPAASLVLDAAFTLAAPANFTLPCTRCASPENPYNREDDGWLSRVYLYNLPAQATVDASRFFVEPVVPLPNGQLGPLSCDYGFGVRVLVP